MPGRRAWLLLLLLLAACTPDATSSTAAKAKPKTPVAAPANADPLRFDGIYRMAAKDPESGSDLGWDYLRFFADGTVLSVSTPADVAQAVAWLVIGNDRVAQGKYRVEGGALHFTLQSGLGKVEYTATLGARGAMDVAWHSGINNLDGGGAYAFVAVEAPKPPEKIAADESLKPAGPSWYCFDAPEVKLSRCDRTQPECDKDRQDTLKESPQGAPAKLGPCKEQKQAFCHTVRSKTSGEGAALCYATQEHCASGLSSLRSADNAREYAISECVAW